MAQPIEVKIVKQTAAEPWPEKSPVSLDGTSASIHLPEIGQKPTLQIQMAVRRLLSLGFDNLKLQGEFWNVEFQFAVAQAVFSAKRVAEIEWAELDDADETELKALIEAHYWTRTMVNKTPEELSPEMLARQAAEFIAAMAPDSVSYEVTVGDKLIERDMVGIHGVGRGSVRPGALLELDFTPKDWGDAPPAVALVGKGITFDSGGYSIKPSESMLFMKVDMGGAATVTGALALAIRRGLNKRVKLYLCCAENLISGHAYKLGDILRYKNGVTVEILNTDAEGRLVLADGLILASESGASTIVDAATLTGAAVTAMGENYNAVFSFDKALRERFLSYSEAEHEDHWPLPLEPFHAAATPSNYADTANSRPVKGGGPGGASNAAGFLSRFVGRKQWLHLDLAACALGNDTAYLSAGGTGKGVRSIARTLLEE